MTTAPETRPIPSGRYGAPVPAPNTPTECPRCGAPAISRNGVALHALDHRNRDLLEKRQEKLLDRLEAFLNGIEHLQTADGTPQRFPDWKQEIDDLVAELPETEGLARLEKLLAPETFEKLLALTTAEAPAPAPAAAEPPRIIAWPDDEDVYASADPDDEPAGFRVTPNVGVEALSAEELERAREEDEIVDGVPLPAEEEPDEDALPDEPAFGPWGAR
jgi:hypothetical protein